jgi:hypothetical protein
MFNNIFIESRPDIPTSLGARTHTHTHTHTHVYKYVQNNILSELVNTDFTISHKS